MYILCMKGYLSIEIECVAELNGIAAHLHL